MTGIITYTSTLIHPSFLSPTSFLPPFLLVKTFKSGNMYFPKQWLMSRLSLAILFSFAGYLPCQSADSWSYHETQIWPVKQMNKSDKAIS